MLPLHLSSLFSLCCLLNTLTMSVFGNRLVAVLADLGPRGGILKFVGKIGVLWGGIRGAMSLTDRLILFLRISERPLFQRLVLPTYNFLQKYIQIEKKHNSNDISSSIDYVRRV